MLLKGEIFGSSGHRRAKPCRNRIPVKASLIPLRNGSFAVFIVDTVPQWPCDQKYCCCRTWTMRRIWTSFSAAVWTICRQPSRSTDPRRRPSAASVGSPRQAIPCLPPRSSSDVPISWRRSSNSFRQRSSSTNANRSPDRVAVSVLRFALRVGSTSLDR